MSCRQQRPSSRCCNDGDFARILRRVSSHTLHEHHLAGHIEHTTPSTVQTSERPQDAFDSLAREEEIGMDGTLDVAVAMEDKENHSPSPSQSLYPRLPPPPPSPLKPRQPHHHHQRLSSGKETPNTSRKRSALTSLLHSPPRPSYADKVRGVFRAQAHKAKPKLHRWDGFGRRVGSEEIVRSEGERRTVSEARRSGEDDVDGEVRPWSPLGSEDEGVGLGPDGRGAEQESRGSVQSAGGDDGSRSGEDVSLAKPVETEELDQARQPPTTFAPVEHEVSPEAKEEEELSVLSSAPATETRPPEPEPHQPTIPSIQEPLPSHDSSSSDSWTGDDDFLPRSARRQKQIDRSLQASPLGRPTGSTTPSSTQLLRPQAPAYTSVNFPVARSGARASRFAKLAVDEGIVYPELPRSPAPSASDHRASDADDEDSNSS